MGHPLRVAATAAAFAAVSLSTYAEPVRVPHRIYPAEIKSIFIQPTSPEPVSVPPVPLDPGARYREAMEHFTLPDDLSCYSETAGSLTPRPAQSSDEVVPAWGYPTIDDAIYARFDDGTYDTDDLIYQRDLSRAEGNMREWLSQPLHRAWHKMTGQPVPPDFPDAWRGEYEPIYRDDAGIGVQVRALRKVDGNARIEIRGQRYRNGNWSLRLAGTHRTRRAYLSVGEKDHQPEYLIGFRWQSEPQERTEKSNVEIPPHVL